MDNRLLNAFMQGMTGGGPMQRGYPRGQNPSPPPPQPFNPLGNPVGNMDPRLIGPLFSSMSPGNAMAMMNRGSGYQGAMGNEYAIEAGRAAPVYPNHSTDQIISSSIPAPARTPVGMGRPMGSMTPPVGMGRPTGSMPTPSGMGRPTFSSWLNQQRMGDGRSTIQPRIEGMRNRASGSNGQIPGDATGMGYNAVRGDATGMGDNSMMNEARRRAAEQRAAGRGGR